MNEKTRFLEIVSIIKNSGLLKGFTPEKLCLTINKLGPTFIKVGQIMSNRYDIFPKEYCEALSKLRSNAVPMGFSEVNRILKSEYDNLDDVYSFIAHDCIGSASIAQVHRATLKSGEEVVIKIQRSNIQETMAVDVKLMKKVIKTFHLNLLIKAVDLQAVIDEIYNVAKEEMDFEIEAKHLIEFKQNNYDIKYVDVPKVYENLSTERVLVMEYIDGINMAETEKLENLGYDMGEIGLKLANNYIKQALDDGFFHADLHLDNVLIRGGKIVYLDLGMMGRLSNRNKMLLKEAVKAIINDDMTSLEHILLSLSTTKQSINHSKLKSQMKQILDQNLNQDIANINIIEFAMAMSNLFRANHIQLDKSITMLMRGICVIEGTLQEIDPSINLAVVLKNKLAEDSFSQFFSKDALIGAGKNMIAGMNSLGELPTEMLNFIRDINHGETKIDIELANSDKQVNKLEKMLHQLIIGLLDAAILLGASLVDNKVIRYIYLAFAILFSIWLFIQMVKDHFHNGY